MGESRVDETKRLSLGSYVLAHASPPGAASSCGESDGATDASEPQPSQAFGEGCLMERRGSRLSAVG